MFVLNQRLIATTTIVAPVLYSSTAVVLTVPWDHSFPRAWNHANHDSGLQGSHARGQGKLRKLERRCCSFFNEHIGTLPVAGRSETPMTTAATILLLFYIIPGSRVAEGGYQNSDVLHMAQRLVRMPGYNILVLVFQISIGRQLLSLLSPSEQWTKTLVLGNHIKGVSKREYYKQWGSLLPISTE